MKHAAAHARERELLLSLMAAILEAGDRANPDISVRCDNPLAYSRRAARLFDTVQEQETP